MLYGICWELKTFKSIIDALCHEIHIKTAGVCTEVKEEKLFPSVWTSGVLEVRHGSSIVSVITSLYYKRQMSGWTDAMMQWVSSKDFAALTNLAIIEKLMKRNTEMTINHLKIIHAWSDGAACDLSKERTAVALWPERRLEPSSKDETPGRQRRFCYLRVVKI